MLRNLYECDDVKKFARDDADSKEFFEKTGLRTPSRTLWIGPSRCGKTNGVINVFNNAPGFYEQCIIVSAEVEEPLYQCLAEKLSHNNTIRFFNINNLPTLQELVATKPKHERWMMIFDDLLNQMYGKNERKVDDYFCMMRKEDIDGHFLTQSLTKTSMNVRKNSEYYMVFALGGKNETNLILRDNSNLSSDSGVAVMKQMYNISVENHGGFLKIDRTERSLVKKYSRNFTDYFSIDEYREHYSLRRPKWYKPSRKIEQLPESENDDEEEETRPLPKKRARSSMPNVLPF